MSHPTQSLCTLRSRRRRPAHATLATGRVLPLTRAGLSPAGSDQLILAHPPFCDRLLKDQLKRTRKIDTGGLSTEKALDLPRVVDRGPCLESGARQRLPSRTTSAPPGLAVSGDTTLLRRFGGTFHCRPSSVMTVTVFLL